MSDATAAPYAGPALDALMRWVREELDLRPRGVRRRLPSPRRGPAPRAAPGAPRIALLTVGTSDGTRGGAERLYAGLEAALAAAGAAVQRVEGMADESSFDAILDSYLAFYDADLSDFDGVVSTKVPSYAVRHRNQVCYLLHTMRSVYDLFERSVPAPTAAQAARRAIIHQIDSAAFARPTMRAVFTVGEEVRLRLRRYNGCDAGVLHHPTTLAVRPGSGARYLLSVGRLHPWKRIGLALEAHRLMRQPVELVVAGTGPEEAMLRAAAGTLPVRFTGWVGDDALARLYADALAVIYCPIGEDYGLVPVEAFLSGKPVVTCADSGEPTRLVEEGASGFICAPTAAALAARLDWLASHPEEAAAMGRRGQARVAGIGWPAVARSLLGALGFAPEGPCASPSSA